MANSPTLRRSVLKSVLAVPLLARSGPSAADMPEVDRGAGDDGSIINVFDALTPAQRRAVRACAPVADLAEAMQDVLDHAGKAGRRVFLPAGGYDLRRALHVPPLVYLAGESPGFPIPTYNPGLSRTTGTVLFKNHEGDCLSVQGDSPYAPSGGVENLVITGDGTAHGGGRGLVVDSIGSYRIRELRIFSVAGDALVLGTSPGDVTGQIHMNGVYINNPGGACIRNRSKWLKASQIETDGGAYSYHASDAPEANFSQFHFEGAGKAGVVLAGANTLTKFRDGFIGLTARGSTKGVEFRSAPGNTDIMFDAVALTGHPQVVAALDIDAGAWRTRIKNCTFTGMRTAIVNRARNARLMNNTFIGAALPIEEQGFATLICGNVMTGTLGGWSIEHGVNCGDGGIWTGNQLDKPIKPAKFGPAARHFGTNIVRDNQGSGIT